MRAYLSTHLSVALHAVVIAVVIIGAAWYIDHSRKETERALINRVDATVARIIELAVMTEKIVVDCPRRVEFENSLQSLGTASRKDLITAQQLFESCGAFFAERKALMVAQLEREYATLESYLSLLGTVRDLTPREAGHYRWKDIVQLEQKRSALLIEQTSIQGEIISLLIEGGNGARINELVRHAQTVGLSITSTDTEIDTLRVVITPQV
jgi:hypothetical protein